MGVWRWHVSRLRGKKLRFSQSVCCMLVQYRCIVLEMKVEALPGMLVGTSYYSRGGLLSKSRWCVFLRVRREKVTDVQTDVRNYIIYWYWVFFQPKGRLLAPHAAKGEICWRQVNLDVSHTNVACIVRAPSMHMLYSSET